MSRCRCTSRSASTTARSSRGCATSTARWWPWPGPDALVLRTPVETRGVGHSTVAEFTVRRGQRVPFSLAWYPSHQDVPRPAERDLVLEPDRVVVAQLVEAVDLRRRLARRGAAVADHAEGAHVRADGRDRRRADDVAARVDRRRPQLGLPVLLAPRRDVHAARAARTRATRTRRRRGASGSCAPSPASPPTCRSCTAPPASAGSTEWEVAWLPGYEGSQPVRIGNAASRAVPARRVRRGHRRALPGPARSAIAERDATPVRLDPRAPRLPRGRVGSEPDEGIWEVRGPRQHFTHSKVMAWVAFDRVVRGLRGVRHAGRRDARRALAQRSATRSTPRCAPRRTTKTARRSSRPTARPTSTRALLMMPLVGFLPATDERMQGTVDAIQRELTTDGFVRRYTTDERASTGSRRAKACSCRARSGSPTTSR